MLLWSSLWHEKAMPAPSLTAALHDGGAEEACLALQIEGSRRNIEEHYDAGNAMYKLFLDETMTYSSGIHRPGTADPIRNFSRILHIDFSGRLFRQW